jgi:hypothetical protein
VYLDSPNSENLLLPAADLFGMTARRDHPGYLVCLFLKLEKNRAGIETGYYKWVGLTKIPNYEGGQNIILNRSIDDDHILYNKCNTVECNTVEQGHIV